MEINPGGCGVGLGWGFGGCRFWMGGVWVWVWVLLLFVEVVLMFLGVDSSPFRWVTELALRKGTWPRDHCGLGTSLGQGRD